MDVSTVGIVEGREEGQQLGTLLRWTCGSIEEYEVEGHPLESAGESDVTAVEIIEGIDVIPKRGIKLGAEDGVCEGRIELEHDGQTDG